MKLKTVEKPSLLEEKNGRHFWARGSYCETVGNVNEATIKRYINEQYENDRLEGE